MNPNDLGPLFQHPAQPHYLWIAAVALAVPAAAIALWGLIRGQLGASLLLNGLLVLPALALLLGNVTVMQESKGVEFCGSCHQTMGPVVAAAFEDNGSLSSQHFRAGAVASADGCYTCHSGYGIWGDAEAKLAGVFHMLHTVTGGYELPLRMRAPFDTSSCLDCHAESPRFRDQPAHRDPDIQQALLSREMTCAGSCHPAAHPEQALMGAAGG